MKTVTSLSIMGISLLVIGCGGTSSSSDASAGNPGTSSSSSGSALENVSKLKVEKINDVAGYTFTSIDAEFGSHGSSTINIVSFDCNLEHKQTLTFKASGATSTTISTGSDVSLDTFNGNYLKWNGLDDEGDTQNNSLSMNSNNEIVTVTSCFADYGSCENGIYLKTIEKTLECPNATTGMQDETEIETDTGAVTGNGNDSDISSTFNVVGEWYGCGGEGCFDLTYRADNTFTQITTSSGFSVTQNGNWRYEDHPNGGNAVMNYNVSIGGMGTLSDYPFKIVDTDTMMNDVQPAVTLKRQ